MSNAIKQFGRLCAFVALVGLSAVVLQAQPGFVADEDGVVTVQGSSTVFPLAVEVADRWGQTPEGAGVEVVINSVGSSGGFRLFGVETDVPNIESDISNASRAIKASEAQTLNDKGVNFVELLLGFDGLTVAVSQDQQIWDEGEAVCMTFGELTYLWGPWADDLVTNWSQIGSRFQDRPIVLSGAADTSGTFDFFNETVHGEDDVTRLDYFPTEDDTILVERVSRTPTELTYFGFAFFVNNQDVLTPVSIDPRRDLIDADEATLARVNERREAQGFEPLSNSGGTCFGIPPTRDTIAAFDYQITRPLFQYYNVDSINNEAETRNYGQFMLDNLESSELFTTVGYVNPSSQLIAAARKCYADRVNGSAFGAGFTGLSSSDILALYMSHCGL